MIRLVDLLTLQGVALENEDYKIHLAKTSEKSAPLDAYLAGTFKEWQEEQTKKNFGCKMILSLIHLGATAGSSPASTQSKTGHGGNAE